MNIDIDLMLTITAGIILSRIISYGFSFFFSSGSATKGGRNSFSTGSNAKGVFERSKNPSLDVETLQKNFEDINNSEML